MEDVRGALLVARRELGAFFNTVWGYAVVAAVLLLLGLAFNAFAMGSTPKLSTEVLEQFFYLASGFTMTAAVLLTIRLFAEERQAGTIVLLDGAPLSSGAVVAGKWLSALAFLSLLLLASVYMPLLVMVNGKVSLAHIAAGYLGLLFLGSACVAMGTFASALTRSQVVAGVIGAVLVVLFVLMWLLAQLTEPPFSRIFEYMSVFDTHFRPFMKGRIETRSLVYYASLTWIFLVATTRLVEWRKWR